MKNRVNLWIAGVLLSSCATMSPEECLQANWEEIGYHDAAAGYTVSRSAEHREACAEARGQVDFEKQVLRLATMVEIMPRSAQDTTFSSMHRVTAKASTYLC